MLLQGPHDLRIVVAGDPVDTRLRSGPPSYPGRRLVAEVVGRSGQQGAAVEAVEPDAIPLLMSMRHQHFEAIGPGVRPRAGHRRAPALDVAPMEGQEAVVGG